MAASLCIWKTASWWMIITTSVISLDRWLDIQITRCIPALGISVYHNKIGRSWKVEVSPITYGKLHWILCLEMATGKKRKVRDHLGSCCSSLGASLKAKCKRISALSSQRNTKLYPFHNSLLDCKSLHLGSNVFDLWSQVTSIVRVDGSRDNRPGHATCSTKSMLTRQKHVWDILVFAKHRDVHQYRERNGVGGENDYLRRASRQGLRD